MLLIARYNLLRSNYLRREANRIATIAACRRTRQSILEQRREFVKASRATSSSDSRKIVVNWADNSASTFHNLWLRDHCKCPECFHQLTNQRLFDTFEIPEDIGVRCLEVTDNGLEITWANNNHKSFYKWSWLLQSSYDPPLRPQNLFQTKKVLWNADISRNPPTVKYKDVMKSNDGLKEWLTKINTYGICFVEDVPPTNKDTEELTNKISFIRETHYGKFWESTSNLSHGDTAYTNLALKAHTDTTYFTDPCGLQLFHLIEFTGEGGTSLFVDGFQTASLLKQQHHDAYSFLSRTPIPTHSAGDATVCIMPTPRAFPIFNHEPRSGILYQIRYNNNDRSVMDHLHPDEIEQFYDALRKWNAILQDKRNEYWVQLEPGKAVVIDNWRVLHGRSAFSGYRKMVGAYVGWDDYQSKLRILTNGDEIKASL